MQPCSFPNSGSDRSSLGRRLRDLIVKFDLGSYFAIIVILEEVAVGFMLLLLHRSAKLHQRLRNVLFSFLQDIDQAAVRSEKEQPHGK